MPSPALLDKHQAVPMAFRRHGDTAPKPRGHALGDAKPASFYIRELAQRGELEGLGSTLDGSTGGQLVSPSPGPFAPGFVVNDKKVLRFGAYFLEPVHESNVENYRVRACEVLLYLEDGSVQITEPKVENSGLLQGNFVKRHRIPMPESDARGNLQFFTAAHLNVGREVTFYGRTFHLISADAFTRQYLQAKLGVQVPEDERPPPDAYTELRRAHMARETGQDPLANYGKKQYPMKAFMEATLGKFARPSEHLRRFLDHDRHVLRFFAVWDDSASLYGLSHQYTLHFFLADNTVEILETYGRNSGCDPFPKLLNRARLAKQLEGIPSGAATIGLTSAHDVGGDEEAAARLQTDFYSWDDLRVGALVDVFRRKLLLLDADESTREWYREQGRPLGPAVSVSSSASPRAPPVSPPPHSGLGSEEDSLLSCYHLLPRAPLKSVESLDTTQVLRFRARFETAGPEDASRRFVMAVIVSDQSVTISEPPQRNAGFGGGKFLERTRVKRPDGSGAYLGLADFFVGARVKVAGRVFVLFEMDEYSAKYMEARPDQFPRADKRAVLRSLRDAVASSRREFMQRVDRAAQLEALGVELVLELVDGLARDFREHDAVTLVRGFGDAASMKIPVDRLAQLVLS